MMKKKLLLFVLVLYSNSCSTSYLGKYSSRDYIENKDHHSGLSKGVYPVSAGAFRFPVSYNSAWSAILDTLIANYSFVIVDKSSGVIATEWDSYYLGDSIFRNKVTVRIKPVSQRSVIIHLHNSQETLSRSDTSSLSLEWLPYVGGQEEVGRIVISLANILRQPKPTLPREMMAKSLGKSKDRN